MSDFNFGEDNKLISSYEDFIRALARSPIETLIISLAQSFFELYSDIGTFKRLSTLQCKYKNLVLPADVAFKFIMAVCQKKVMRYLIVSVKLEMEEPKFDAMAEMMSKLRSLSSMNFGSNAMGMVKERYISSIHVLKKSNPLINMILQHGGSDDEFEDMDDDFDEI
jgi:hypothetical protein